MLSVGHTWTDIQNYTLSQFKTFLRAAVRFQKIEEVTQLQTVALGAQGTSDGIKKTLDLQIKQLKNG